MQLIFLLQGEFSGRTKQQVERTLKIEEDFFSKHKYEYRYLETDLSDISCTYIICASHTYDDYAGLDYQYSVLMTHGIGTKRGYFQENNTKYDIQFCEGSYRKETLEKLFPNAKTKFINVGFAKLDAAVNLTNDERHLLIDKYGLDSRKKTILYSPTFYPSSIERIKRNFPEDLSNYNIIIKPHFFSYELKKYFKQRHLLKKWDKYSNVYLAPLEEFNLVPFMAIADIMITDESSAMFEFIALDKPMICYRDVKLRWTYRIFKNKLKKRMDPHIQKFNDSFANAHSYTELLSLVNLADKSPENNSNLRQQMSLLLVGNTDGKVSERIVKHLIDFSKEKQS